MQNVVVKDNLTNRGDVISRGLTRTNRYEGLTRTELEAKKREQLLNAVNKDARKVDLQK